GIAQVGDAVNQLDQVTQQNAALVEESAAAADSLRNQAARLAKVVSAFKLQGGALNMAGSSAQPRHTPAPQAARAPAAPALKRPSQASLSSPQRAAANAPALASAPKASSTSGNDDWESF
ncbi:methyl-accepting chemotaxis protein, partial [Curvibacter sp. HBC28]|nr:methyl-accepting chemotaxis protein [Curvibacter sp. HBC28]